VRAILPLALGLLLACVGERAPAPGRDRPLVLRSRPAGDSLRLTLVAAPGWKINARLKPVLEYRDGTLDAARLTPDSAYFSEPPVAIVAEGRARYRGTLRASVCAAGEAVCRLVTLEVPTEQ
jgi:hypothetical protein